MATFAADAQNEEGNPESGETTADLLSKRDWSKTQTLHQKAQTTAAKTDLINDEEEVSIERLSEGQQQLLDTYIEKNKRELIVKRMQLGTLMVEELFEKAAVEKDTAEQKQTLAKAKYLEELLLKQCATVSSILKQLKDMETKQKRLAKLKQNNLVLMTEDRKKMEDIEKKEESAMKAAGDEESKELLSELDKILQKIAIARQTLQALVIGSGVNWAQDPALEELVLKLGEKLEL